VFKNSLLLTQKASYSTDFWGVLIFGSFVFLKKKNLFGGFTRTFFPLSLSGLASSILGK
jgi:hypothetical protein